ncbi:hypothetical protein NUU61_002049 [Penicillium alfredii]|uniref:Cytochrome P450 n=1 Tax=Penicillium alfredii TaxID=1506179 RepID=A0A9W9KGX9_9EURO|nr:uncharacterized protein NUU61_002049 [Penicillium alfredii]KAJ5104702.1 hypothetical protein NUU61_002049 [Penicillium alfredii]
MLTDYTNMPLWAEFLPLCGILILGPILLLYVLQFKSSSFPLINPKRPFEFNAVRAKKIFLSDGHNLIKSGLSKSSIFRLFGDNGYRTVLSPKYADEIRSHPALSFSNAIRQEFHGNIKGFEPFKQFSVGNEVFQDAVRMKLTQALEWHEFPIKASILKLVAQLSSRVFLGDQICHNLAWLRVTVDYTVHSVRAAEDLRLWPSIMRTLVAPFLTSCRRMKYDFDEARKIIIPILEERRKRQEAALRDGKPPKRNNDAMDWMEEIAKGRPYDPVAIQLTFSVAAIHTTSDMMTQALYDLCGRDELVNALREEIVSVIQAEGWKKTALYKLQLMDSFLKESQRLKPINIVSMRRLASEPIQLSDGNKIPKGTSLMVSGDWMWDPTFYENPDTFDAYRFLKLRQTPGRETSSHLVSPSPEHLGFGLGKHACPGRFFAANEIKIALCHILLKYDLKLPENCVPQHRKYGLALQADPEAKIMVRRRREEINLGNTDL